MIDVVLLLLLLLVLKHFICDFVVQTQYQLRYKGIYGHPAGLLHAGLHATGSAAVLIGLGVAGLLSISIALLAALLAAEFVLHYHIDWGKEQVVKPFVEEQGTAYWAIFGFDQFLHQATYVAMAYVVFRA
jgi:hypothetical protein